MTGAASEPAAVPAAAAGPAGPAESPGPAEPPGPPAWWRPLDAALRISGGLVAAVGALASAVLELQLAPYRVGGVLVGVSVLLAVVVNAALPWFTAVTTGRRRLALLPAGLWFVVMMAAGVRRDEGDFLLVGDWVGVLTLALGSIAFGVAGYRLVLRPPVQPARAAPGGAARTAP
ncbi:MAG TPA: hypothetical protein VNV66_04055 [Pilimelia sp.]|nr:hypothetical protein [Pilimelia sp.]